MNTDVDVLLRRLQRSSAIHWGFVDVSYFPETPTGNVSEVLLCNLHRIYVQRLSDVLCGNTCIFHFSYSSRLRLTPRPNPIRRLIRTIIATTMATTMASTMCIEFRVLLLE